ncbi:MAG: nucleotidyltransferase domain-containing protein, partial [Spirochaetia bacterium]
MKEYSDFRISSKKYGINTIKYANSLLERIVKFITDILKDDIYSVYLKGSYIHLHWNTNSDIDIVVIVKSNNDIVITKSLDGYLRDLFKIQVEIRGYTIKELLTGESPCIKGSKSPAFRFSRFLNYYPLLYGKDLLKYNLHGVSDIYNLTYMKKLVTSFITESKDKISPDDFFKQAVWYFKETCIFKKIEVPYANIDFYNFLKYSNHFSAVFRSVKLLKEKSNDIDAEFDIINEYNKKTENIWHAAGD